VKHIINNAKKPIIIWDATEITQELLMDILKPWGNGVYALREHAENAIKRGHWLQGDDIPHPDALIPAIIQKGRVRGWAIRHKDTQLLSNGMSIQHTGDQIFVIKPDQADLQGATPASRRFKCLAEALVYASDWERPAGLNGARAGDNTMKAGLATDLEADRVPLATESETKVLGDTVSNLLGKEIALAKGRRLRAKRKGDMARVAECDKLLRRLRQRVFRAEDNAYEVLSSGQVTDFKHTEFVTLHKALQRGLAVTD